MLMQFPLLQKGVSLIEILVTTLILGVGLLGVAALQVSSTSGNMEGFFQSQATSIAEDAASRMRSSKFAIYDSNYSSAMYVADYTSAGALACGAKPKMCRRDGGSAAKDCSFVELVSFDQWEICDIAKETLPEGKVYFLANGERISIVVEWASAKARADMGQVNNVNSNCNAITGNADRNCVLMEVIP